MKSPIDLSYLYVLYLIDYEILEEGPDGSKSPRLTKKEKKLQSTP
jgi:hypothetical protein